MVLTIREIEERVGELCPGAEGDRLKALALLVAAFRVGAQWPRLKGFTGYDAGFIRECLDELRAASKLYMGEVSRRFLLKQIPGAESLIGDMSAVGDEQTFDGRMLLPLVSLPKNAPYRAKVKPPPDACSRTADEAATDSVRPMEAYMAKQKQKEAACSKLPGCGRPARHRGLCKGDPRLRENAKKRWERSVICATAMPPPPHVGAEPPEAEAGAKKAAAVAGVNGGGQNGHGGAGKSAIFEDALKDAFDKVVEAGDSSSARLLHVEFEYSSGGHDFTVKADSVNPEGHRVTLAILRAVADGIERMLCGEATP
jgi:hypothetical protein